MDKSQGSSARKNDDFTKSYTETGGFLGQNKLANNHESDDKNAKKTSSIAGDRSTFRGSETG